jgi:hypothetical protein
VLFVHLGGTPALHAYAEHVREAPLRILPHHADRDDNGG